jgi:hypothetical protein
LQFTSKEIAVTQNKWIVMSAHALLIAAFVGSTSSVASSQSRQTDRGPTSQNQSSGGRQSINSIPRATPDVVKRTSDFFRTFQTARVQPRSYQDCATALNDFERARSNFSTRLEAFLSGPKDERALFRDQAGFETQMLSQQRDIETYAIGLANAGKRSPEAPLAPLEQDVCFAKVQRAELVNIRDYANAVAKLYPNLSTTRPVIQAVDQALSQAGDDAAILAIVTSNRGVGAAQNRLPAPLSTNPAWIAMFRAHFTSAFPGWTYLGQSLYSANWYVKRNDVTNIAEYRQIGTRIAARAADGTCSIMKIDRYETWNGASFADGRFENAGTSAAVCANLR